MKKKHCSTAAATSQVATAKPGLSRVVEENLGFSLKT